MKRKEIKDLTKNKKKINIKANNNLMEEGIVLEQGKYKITMLPLEENKKPSIYKKEGLVKFKKFNKKDDLEYEIKSNGLKENIIINEQKEEYKYKFLLKLTNLKFDELDKTFKDLDTNKPVFKLLDLVMFDASKVESKDIEELVTKLDNNDIKLTIIPNKEWLNHKERVFPITLDPSFEVVEEDIITMNTNNEELSVGFINSSSESGEITLNIEGIKNEIKSLGLSRYKVFLKLPIVNKFVENYCGYYLVHSNGRTVFDGNIEFKNAINIDITPLVEEKLTTENNTILLEIYNNTLVHIKSTELDELNRTISNDYIEIATPHYKDEEYHPKLTLEYLSSEVRPDQDATITYDLDIQGQTNVNLYDGSFIHEVPLANISENSLQADLSLVFNKRLFDDTSIDKEEKYINKGFKTNMHQYLVKEENFNPLTGGRKITYVDGQGFTHELIEKWYYEDENNVKHFIPKDDVFLDDDGLIKINVDDDLIEVKYEVENDDGLSYVSASSMYNYRPKVQEKYYIEYKNSRKYIDINEKINELYFYKINNTKIYVKTSDIYVYSNGILRYNDYKLYKDAYTDLDLLKDSSGNLYLEGKYSEIKKVNENGTVELDEYFYRIDIFKEIIETESEASDFYKNDEILNMEKQIKNLELNIKDVEKNKKSILQNIKKLENNYLSVVNQNKNAEIIIECKNLIYEWQKLLKDQEISFYQNYFYDFNESGKDIIEKSIDHYEYVNGIMQNSNAFFIHSLNDLTIEDCDGHNEDFTGGITISKHENAKKEPYSTRDRIIEYRNIIDGFDRLNRIANISLESTELFQLTNETYNNTNDELQREQLNNNLQNIVDSLNEYNEQYMSIICILSDLYYDLNQSNIKMSKLINEQRKQVNDYIIDKSGNTLGFNGFGQLIMLIDKYENQININYDENNEKIESISNKTQTILFKYNDNNQLESIIDQDGRVTLIECSERFVTVTYKYLKDQSLSIRYDENYFEITDDLDRNAEIAFLNGKIKYFIRYIDSSCRIDETNLNYVDEEFITTINDSFSYELNKTKITNIYGEVKEIMFDANGRLLNIIDDKDVHIRRVEDNKLIFNVSYNEDKHVLDYAEVPEVSYNEDKYLSCSMSTTFDVSDSDIQNLINKHRLLGFVLELGDLNVNSSSRIQQANLSVYINEGDYQIEQDYYEVENQTLVLPFTANFDIETIKATVSFNEDVSLSNIKGFKLVALTGSIYTYDDKDRLEFVETGLTTTEYFDYVNDKPTTIEFTDKYDRVTKSRIIYDSKDRLTYQEDSNGNVKECFYDEKDNLIEERTYNKKDPTMSSVKKYNYDECGNVTELDGLLKDKNGLKHNTKLEYVPGTSLVRKISNSNNVKCFGYDRQTNELLSFSSNGDQVNNSNRFTYNYGLMTSMSHHGQSVKYTYDSLGRVTNVNLFGIEDYIKTSYYDNKLYSDNYMRLENASWSVTTYANGRLKITVYDKDGKLVKLKDDDRLFYYTYDEEDRLLKDEITYYEYDNNGLVINKQTPFIYSKYIYDENDRLTQEETSINSLQTQVVTSYEYDDLDQVVSTTIDDNFKVTYERDCLNRTIKENTLVNNVGRLSEEYVYLQEEDNTTNLIKEHVFKYFNSVTDINTYEYDEHGNITNIEDIEGNKTRYTYDSLNRLVREDNSLLNKTITIKYDAGGNILFKKEHPYTLEDELPICSNKYLYGYASNKKWKDRLVSFNGKSIAYGDEYGRPLIYKEDTLTWNNFNQLVTYKKENETNKLNLVYNEYGIRIRKYKDDYSLDISYVVDGNKVSAMIDNNSNNLNTPLLFRYSLDKLKGFTYNNIEYIYKRNIQGDIIQIINGTGDVVAKYIYDAWGNHKVLNPDGTENTNPTFIGNINPFRYRGYLFDPETNLYYLNSRYYDSEVGRFISPDSIDYLDPESINGLNLYCYCYNNPIMYSDPSGHFVITLSAVLAAAAIGAAIGAVSGAVYGGITAAANGQNVWVGIGIGALTGGFMGAGAGVASLFIAPVLVGEGVMVATATGAGFVMGNALSAGAALAIGTGIAFGTGFVGGMFADASTQVINDGGVNDWGSVFVSGIQWGLINTAGAFLGSMGGTSTLNGALLSAIFGGVTGAVGMTIDILRNRKNQKKKVSVNNQLYAYCF